VKSEQLAFVRGWGDTRAALRTWNGAPARVLAPWAAVAAGIAVALLLGTWAVAARPQPDLSPVYFPGVNVDASLDEYRRVLVANGLVLALHAMACVAGFMAGASMPQLAAARTGLSRAVHEHAGRFAILFVIAATIFSLGTQAYVLGSITSTLSAQDDVAPAVLLLGLLPHALPELTALFLPLAAWTLASRRGEWNQLLAATFVTTAIALPVLLASALVEVYVSPHLIGVLIK
jgi:hypothetical protein